MNSLFYNCGDLPSEPEKPQKRDDLGTGIENPKFNYYRAAGDLICLICGEKYIEHPVVRVKEKREIRDRSGISTFWDDGCEFYVLCNTDRVKL